VPDFVESHQLDGTCDGVALGAGKLHNLANERGDTPNPQDC
jgi:hypothetical protein